jgi:hypothetical protein
LEDRAAGAGKTLPEAIGNLPAGRGVAAVKPIDPSTSGATMPEPQSAKAMPLMSGFGERRDEASRRRRSEAWTRPPASAGLYGEVKSSGSRPSLVGS